MSRPIAKPVLPVDTAPATASRVWPVPPANDPARVLVAVSLAQRAQRRPADWRPVHRATLDGINRTAASRSVSDAPRGCGVTRTPCRTSYHVVNADLQAPTVAHPLHSCVAMWLWAAVVVYVGVCMCVSCAWAVYQM